MPQRHDEPVQHAALRDDAVPEPPSEGPPRVGVCDPLADQQDGGRDGEEGEDRQRERGIASREGKRTEGYEPRDAAAAHSTTSRPSSIDR